MPQGIVGIDELQALRRGGARRSGDLNRRTAHVLPLDQRDLCHEWIAIAIAGLVARRSNATSNVADFVQGPRFRNPKSCDYAIKCCRHPSTRPTAIRLRPRRHGSPYRASLAACTRDATHSVYLSAKSAQLCYPFRAVFQRSDSAYCRLCSYACAIARRSRTFRFMLPASATCTSVCCRLTTACSRRPSQSSNLHTQICRLSGARLMLAVRRHRHASLSVRASWQSRVAFIDDVAIAVMLTCDRTLPFAMPARLRCSSLAALRLSLVFSRYVRKAVTACRLQSRSLIDNSRAVASRRLCARSRMYVSSSCVARVTAVAVCAEVHRA